MKDLPDAIVLASLFLSSAICAAASKWLMVTLFLALVALAAFQMSGGKKAPEQENKGGGGGPPNETQAGPRTS